MSDNKKQLPTNKKPQSARPKALISEEEREGRESKKTTNPTRFGDWEKNGRCIDF